MRAKVFRGLNPGSGTSRTGGRYVEIYLRQYNRRRDRRRSDITIGPKRAARRRPARKTGGEAALKACTQQPWPYLNCVGTPLGNPRIRLVTTDRLMH